MTDDWRGLDDRSAFWRAISNAYRDSAPKLVFADWLDEFGRMENDAARFEHGERGGR